MALPKLNETVNFAKITLLSGKKIGIRQWRIKDEKDLLFVTEGVDDEDVVTEAMVNFLRNCVDDQELFDTLSETDILEVASQMRQLSKGGTVEFTFRCSNPECKIPNEGEVKIDEIVRKKEFDGKPYEVIPGVFVTFKEISHKRRVELEKASEKLTEYNFKYLCNSIETVTVNGVTYTEFTPEEVELFLGEIDDLTAGEKLYEEMDKRVATFDLDIKGVCSACKTETEVVFTNPLAFFVF